MIKEFEYNNQKLNFGLINVVTGKNLSGKTHFLDTIKYGTYVKDNYQSFSYDTMYIYNKAVSENATEIQTVKEMFGFNHIDDTKLLTNMAFQKLVTLLYQINIAKEESLFFMYNPEAYLYPSIIYKFTEYIVSEANKGIQFFIETHSNDVNAAICCSVFNNKIDHKEVVFLHKDNIEDEFDIIHLSSNGKYVDKDGKRIEYPSGFFDNGLNDLMKIL